LYGLTQEDLALAIDVTKQAISKYELGSSIPERDILLNLSHYFRVTENELLNGDFEGIGTIANAPILERDYTVGILEKFFPIVCTSSALKNTTRASVFSPEWLLEEDTKYLDYQPKRTYVGYRYHDGYSDHLPVVLKIKSSYIK
jgi:transcriptional regulator with XRE-family HTH domain